MQIDLMDQLKKGAISISQTFFPVKRYHKRNYTYFLKQFTQFNIDNTSNLDCINVKKKFKSY